MLPIAGQTAGPIGLELFVDTQGWPGSVIKNSKFIKHFLKLFFHGQRRALQLVIYIMLLITKDEASETTLWNLNELVILVDDSFPVIGLNCLHSLLNHLAHL